MQKEGDGTAIDRQIILTGNLSDEQQERLLQIANACPVHKILSNPISIRTGLAVA
jgi:putative redox protein